MGETAGYDDDVFAWAEQQAAVLRRLSTRRDLPNELDLVHVAEEIEGLGISELRAVESHLENILVHLLKLWADPTSLAAEHREDEIFAWQADLLRRITPAMRRRIALDALWAGVLRRTERRFRRLPAVAQERVATLAAAQPACPWSLDDLCDPDFDPATALHRLPAAA
jgi:hypothetical protein